MKNIPIYFELQELSCLAVHQYKLYAYRFAVKSKQIQRMKCSSVISKYQQSWAFLSYQLKHLIQNDSYYKSATALISGMLRYFYILNTWAEALFTFSEFLPRDPGSIVQLGSLHVRAPPATAAWPHSCRAPAASCEPAQAREQRR